MRAERSTPVGEVGEGQATRRRGPIIVVPKSIAVQPEVEEGERGPTSWAMKMLVVLVERGRRRPKR